MAVLKSRRLAAFGVTIGFLVSAVVVTAQLATASGPCDALLVQADAAVADAYQKMLTTQQLEAAATGYYQTIITSANATQAQKNLALQYIQAATQASADAQSRYFQAFDKKAAMDVAYAADPGCSSATEASLSAAMTDIASLLGAGFQTSVTATKTNHDLLKQLAGLINPVTLIIPNGVGVRLDERLADALEPGAKSFVATSAVNAIASVPADGKFKGVTLNDFQPNIDLDFDAPGPGIGGGQAPNGKLVVHFTAPPSKLNVKLDPFGIFGEQCTVYLTFSSIALDFTFNLRPVPSSGAFELELVDLNSNTMSITRDGSSGICWVASVKEKILGKADEALAAGTQGIFEIDGGPDGFKLDMIPAIAGENQIGAMFGLNGADPLEDALNSAVTGAINGVLPANTSGLAALSDLVTDDRGLIAKLDLQLTGAVSPTIPASPNLDAALADRFVGGSAVLGQFAASVFIDPNVMQEAFGIPFAPATLYAPIMPAVSIGSPFNLTGTWLQGSGANAGPFLRAYLRLA